MKKVLLILLPIAFLFSNCETNTNEGSIEKWKEEIVDTEQKFAAMAAKEGIPKAFLAFAAEDVVVKKRKRVLIGIEALRESYKDRKPDAENVSLTWKPDFVDVAASGDLGYTYGQYISTKTDSTGVVQRDTGIFHTVWKRQADGNWKFVWD